jgi:DNA-directed RNA polymerase subunit RPC12/RpoP
MMAFICASQYCGRTFESVERYPECPHCGNLHVTVRTRENASERSHTRLLQFGLKITHTTSR